MTDYSDRIHMMYTAYYGRMGDPTGVEYWNGRLNEVGGSWEEIIDAFGNSPEFVEYARAKTFDDLVDDIYENCFDRAPDPAGLDYYVDLLVRGESSLGVIALDVANGAQDSDLETLNKKIAMSTFILDALSDNNVDMSDDDMEVLISLMNDMVTNDIDEMLDIIMQAFSDEPISEDEPTASDAEGQDAVYDNYETDEIVHAMYLIYFNRFPDKGELDYWVNYIDTSGLPLNETIIDFGNTQEFVDDMSVLDNEELVNYFFQSGFGRNSTNSDIIFYEDSLDDAELTLSQVVLDIIRSLDIRNNPEDVNYLNAQIHFSELFSETFPDFIMSENMVYKYRMSAVINTIEPQGTPYTDQEDQEFTELIVLEFINYDLLF